MKRVRRILMTTDPVGGVWTYSLELARSLQEHHYEVILASMGGEISKAQNEEVCALSNVTLFSSPYRLEWMDNPWKEVDEAGKWLLSLAEETKPECIHLNGYSHASLPWNVPVVVVAHSCVCSWWRAVHQEEAPAKYDLYRERVQRGLDAATFVVAPTHAMLEALRRCWRIEPEKARVVWNGRTFPRPSARERTIGIFTAGRIWDPAKNISILDKVAPGLQTEVVVAGERCPPVGKASRFDHVRAVGSLSRVEMQEHLERAMIYASPARYEPFGLSVLEAALSGCALVLSSLPSFKELWGDAALYLPPDDPARWQKELLMLLNNREYCAELGERARRRAQRYSSGMMGADYQEVYSIALRNTD